MKRLIYFLVLMTILTTVAYSYPESKYIPTIPGSISVWDTASSTWRPVAGTASGAVVMEAEVTSSVDLGSTTIDTIPSFEDSTGSATRAVVDSSQRAIVNLGSETVGLITSIEAVETDVESVATAVEPSTEVAAQVVTLVADTSQSISSGLTGSRKFIEITAMDNTEDFWLNFDTAAVENGCRRVYGGIYLEFDKSITPHVIASEALDLMVIEGGM